MDSVLPTRTRPSNRRRSLSTITSPGSPGVTCGQNRFLPLRTHLLPLSQACDIANQPLTKCNEQIKGKANPTRLLKIAKNLGILGLFPNFFSFFQAGHRITAPDLKKGVMNTKDTKLDYLALRTYLTLSLYYAWPIAGQLHTKSDPANKRRRLTRGRRPK